MVPTDSAESRRRHVSHPDTKGPAAGGAAHLYNPYPYGKIYGMNGDSNKTWDKIQAPRSGRAGVVKRLGEWEKHGTGDWGMGVAADLIDLEKRVAELERNGALSGRETVQQPPPVPASAAEQEALAIAIEYVGSAFAVEHHAATLRRLLKRLTNDTSPAERTPERKDTPSRCTIPNECTKPVAWAVYCDGVYDSSFCGADGKNEAEEWANECRLEKNGRNWGVVPLYPRPKCQDNSQKNLTLTRRETDAIAVAMLAVEAGSDVAAALRGILGRCQ